MTIRPARPDDLASLTSRLRQNGYFADRLARQARGDGVLLTAWQAGLLVGVVYLWLEVAEEPEIREHLPGTPLITHLEVHRDHRGKGIGTRLIGAAEHLLTRCGFTKVALAVELRNRAAARLYTRLGYHVWPHPTVKCHSPADVDSPERFEICNVMVKRLTE
ncbi:GNAT family N-acetyltransferase [Lentzea fradiae]|uniref:GNAT family N-acetyltransferase n=1 Tax=Lentzea fradiae TaxID=200378 RepID=UPI0015A11578|nr:GNAT family N-acetyltransferase [Lentzea fradiae]